MECLRDFRSCDRMSSPRASFAIHPLLVPKPVAACHVAWRGDPERRGRLSRSATDRLSGSPALTRTRCFGWLAGSPSRSGEHTCRDLVCPKHDSGRRESGSEPGPGSRRLRIKGTTMSQSYSFVPGPPFVEWSQSTSPHGEKTHQSDKRVIHASIHLCSNEQFTARHSAPED